jgi:hypothetical protein
MRIAREQLDAELDYSDWVIGRNAAVLESSTQQLQIAGQRELGEMSHHLAIDSAAVVATLFAFVVLEAVSKPLGLEQNVVGIGMVMAAAALAFSALIWQASFRKGPLQLGSVALTVALIGVTLLAWMTLGLPEVDNPAAGSLRTTIDYYGRIVVLVAAAVWLLAWLRNAGFRRLLHEAAAALHLWLK